MANPRRPTIGSLVVATILLGCSPAASPSAQAQTVRGEAGDSDYILIIASPRAIWATAEAIEVDATLRYIGLPPTTTIWSSGGGGIKFSVEELAGNRTMDAISDLVCTDYSIGWGQPIVASYMKSGGFSAEDPNAAFYTEFFEDPLFHLPLGQWKITAFAQFNTGDGCNGSREVDLRASLIITVE